MYTIRKCLKETSWKTTGSVDLDPEKFRNISEPYTGNSETEFMDYIGGLDFYSISEELDEETADNLEVIIGECPEYEEYINSAWKYEDSWLEIGKVNPEYTKNGKFETTHTQES